MRTTYLIAGFSLTALLCAGAANGADPRLMNLVMPDATTLAGANVTNAEITPFGQYVLTQLTATANLQLQKFITTTGFDPRQDLSEVLAASSGSAANPEGLVLGLGNFPVTQITAAIAAATTGTPGTQGTAPTIETYGGATLITDTTAKATYSIAFLGTTIAVIGDTASVKAAIDRSTGANSISPALAVQVQALSMTEDAWAVTNSPVSSLIPGLGASTTGTPLSQFAQMFSGILGSSGGIKFGTTVVITGQALTNDAGTAKSLADVLQALASIASMAGGQDSEMASLAQILQGLKVSADGTTINLALSIPETQLESILNAMKNQPKPAAKAAIKPVVLLQ